MATKILLLMILLHVIDDFVLQPVCLSKLKQKSWWEAQDGFKSLYKNDYKMALLMHSMSWSVMILLPFIFMFDINGHVLYTVFAFNTLIHYITDNEKANKGHLNLMVDQTIHIMQVIATWILVQQWVV